MVRVWWQIWLRQRDVAFFRHDSRSFGGSSLRLLEMPRRSAALPFAGWIVLAGGIYIAARAIRGHEIQDSDRAATPCQRRRGQCRRIKFAGASAIGVLASVGAQWWGISSGQLSVVGTGIAPLGLFVLTMPRAVSSLAWLVRR